VSYGWRMGRRSRPSDRPGMKSAKGSPVSEITAGAIPETTSLKPSCESSAADHAMAPV